MAPLDHHFMTRCQDIRIVLAYAPLGFVKAVVQHIYPTRMLVNTGFITLNHNAEIDIVLQIPKKNGGRPYHIPAQVSGCEEDGDSTLDFRCCSEEAMLALRPYLTSQ